MTTSARFAPALVFLAIAGVLATATPVAAQYALQYGAAIDVDGSQVFIGEGRNLLLPGSVFVYNVDEAGHWEEAAELKAWEGSGDADGFGRAIAASGSYLFVGAPEVQRVFVFRKDAGGAWSRSAVLESEHARFGSAVDASGETLIVGAPGGRDVHGVAQVFTQGSAGWSLHSTLVSADTSRGAGFGSAVAAAGERIVIGAPGASQRTGSVSVFDYNGSEWEEDIVQMPAPNTNDRFGSALLAADDSRIAVGSPGRDRQMGAVALFERNNEDGTWSFDRRLSAPSASGGEMFGSALAWFGNSMAVGAPGFGEREGAVYLYGSVDGATLDLLAPGVRQFRSGFGTALGGGEGLLVVGAVGHDNFEGAAFPVVMREDDLHVGDRLINNSGQFASVTGGMVECEEGAAEGFGCSEVDMLSFLSRDDVGAKRGIQVNDVWGWEDPDSGREFAIVGRTDGTSFVELSDPYNPVYLGNLPMTSTANQSIWRDIKVYKNHAFIVSDGAGAHHMQIFDLTQLRDVKDKPATFEVTALYKGIYSSHNIVINEETGFAYAVGSDSGGETCGGALHMINIQDPVNPTFAGCFADIRTGRGTGATHDAQCVVYRGPDADYDGREICLSSNGSALSIADVTDKENPRAISIADYPNVAYTHQGWLTEDHRYFFLNDEGDEVSNLVEGTRTLILDLTDLDDPVVANEYIADHNSIDHNLYVRGNLMYQTNYSAGLRLLDVTDPENPVEIGHFDTVPYGKNDNSPVLGAWSNYPYFKSGVIVVTSGREGVFFLKKRAVDI